MRAGGFFLFALVVLAAADDLEDHQTGHIVQVTPVALGVTQNGETVVIAAVSRAPFPLPHAVPASRIAMMRVLANCRQEAFALCHVHADEPVCPMRVAHCLADQPKEHLSSWCGASVVAMQPHLEEMSHSPHLNNIEDAESEEDEDLGEVQGESSSQMHNMVHRIHCGLRRSLRHVMGRVPGFLMCFITGVVLALLCHMLLQCVCSYDEEEEEDETTKVVMSQPYEPPTLVLTAPVLTTEVVMQGSENQV